jgi:hypothetical protein
MTLIGLDLNATRARAAHGPAGAPPAGLPLEDDGPELPLALSLEGRSPEAGRAGAALARKAPHLACLDFLPQLGTQKVWAAGRHRLDAAGALGVVFAALQRRFGANDGAAAALPTYLTAEQRSLVTQAASRARWRLLATAPAPVAAALAAYEELPWSGLALVLDLDDYGLTWSAVALAGERVRLVRSETTPALGRGAWLRRLLEGVARRCIRLSRRDPRESADAEQSLYDQLADVLATHPEGGRVELMVQTPHWYQNLMLAPEELQALCAPLVGQTLTALDRLLELAAGHGPASAVLLTAPAGRLPGLTPALEDRLRAPGVVRLPQGDSDYGEGLALDEGLASARLHALGADALARAAHGLAACAARGDLPGGHHELAPLLAAPAAPRGAPRLQFRGRDYALRGTAFAIGRDPACDLVLDSSLYPTVSARHCEVVLERGAYVLRDRSRHGTLVNDCPVAQPTPLRSGDWIRLGPGGPLLRFLGHAEALPMVTIA